MVDHAPAVVAFDAIDCTWLSLALKSAGYECDVSSFTATPIGTGQVGDSVRFDLTFSKTDNVAPDTIVGKFPAADEASRQTGRMFNNYIREVNFYRQLAGDARIHTPRVYFVDIIDDTHDFVLLMEDLAPAQQGDQTRGLSLNQVKLALREAARLHSSHWKDESLDQHGWLNGTSAAPQYVTNEFIQGLWAEFCDRYEDAIPNECREVGEAYCKHIDYLKDGYEGVRCLTHGDFRPDNMMFATPAGGYPMTTLDWQTAAYSGPMFDVSYFLSGALTRDQRRDHETELLNIYQDELVRQGVDTYDRDQLEEDYAYYSFSLFVMAFTASMVVERTERGDAMFLSMLKGGSDHAHDTGILKRLASR